MSHILCIETANPAHLHQQKDLATFYNNTVEEGDTQTRRRIGAVARNSGINQRFSVLPDFSRNQAGYTIFPKDQNLKSIPGLSDRMAIFRKEAVKLSLDAVNKIQNFDALRDDITHIITVTCTGLFAPGLDVELARALRLSRSVQRSSINFMGCNAAILALKQASQICCSDSGALVLIVCTELCTLHFQREHTDDYIMSNMLFADGSAAALVGKPRPQITSRPMRVSHFHSLLLHEGHEHMAWRLSEKGFIMNLSSYVSGLLNANMEALLSENGISRREIRHWAIHPGGRKILDDFCTTMTIGREELLSSYQVLREYGNMSSATIFFVLKRLPQDREIKTGEKVYTAAFGPGLSIESAIVDYV